MSYIRKDDLRYVDFDIFKKFDFIKCAISTKHGGVSEGFYESMNLSFSIGDDENKVFSNYKKISDELGFTYENINRGYQTHGINCRVVSKENFKKFSNFPQFEDTDIVLTAEKNIPLVTLFADCVPLFFVDAEHKAIGVAHAGWRGTVNSIAEKAVLEMQKNFGTKKEFLYVGIGPSIHSCCFLVDSDVFLEFDKVPRYKPYIKKVENKFSIDLQQINKLNLLKTGLVLEENIEISPFCTCCLDDFFFSHRRQNLQRGSMAGFLEVIK